MVSQKDPEFTLNLIGCVRSGFRRSFSESSVLYAAELEI
jgi:hypothetical protein